MKRTFKLQYLKQPSQNFQHDLTSVQSPNSTNMFEASINQSSIIDQNTCKYHIVGDLSFKQSLIEKSLQLPKISISQATQASVSKNSSNYLSSISRGKRLSLSNSTKEEQQLINRDKRNMLKLAYYQREWRTRQYRRYKQQTEQEMIRLIVEENPQNDNSSKNNRGLCWKNNLRNHEKAYQNSPQSIRHDQLKLKNNLYTIDGYTEAEKDTHKLSLKREKQKSGFCLRGRNKSQIIHINEDEGNNRSFSVEQVLKSLWKRPDISKLYNN